MKAHYQDTKILLSRKNLSERWGCSVETLKRREKAGVLRPIVLGRLVRYKLGDIESVEAAALVKGGSAL